MKFILADRQQSARSALRLLLEQYDGMEFVGGTDELAGLLNLVASSKPGLILVEWEMLGCWPKGQITALKNVCQTSIIVLDCCLDRRNEAIAAGADYYVSKSDNPEHIMAVLSNFTNNLESNNNPGTQVS
ncbi:hypothetical protein DGWBC_0707 [Dehalogenimonas sp. WBC-2]|nr:hypothetical protein DGWBC_0707 [Dehalogenimonas sp. WBC-2]